MTLADTTKGMNSSDWKERFKAEYWQAKIRRDELHKMIIKYEAGTLTFTPNCSLDIFEEQEHHLESYIRILEIRAEIEHIRLTEVGGEAE